MVSPEKPYGWYRFWWSQSSPELGKIFFAPSASHALRQAKGVMAIGPRSPNADVLSHEKLDHGDGFFEWLAQRAASTWLGVSVTAPWAPVSFDAEGLNLVRFAELMGRWLHAPKEQLLAFLSEQLLAECGDSSFLASPERGRLLAECIKALRGMEGKATVVALLAPNVDGVIGPHTRIKIDKKVGGDGE